MRKIATSVFAWLIAPLWPITLIGLVLGAFVGTFATQSNSPGHIASAIVRVHQPVDPNQFVSGSAPAVDFPSFMSGEIAYLASPAFADAVGKGMGKPYRVSVTVSQLGQSPLIAISADGVTFDIARTIVDTAVRAYTEAVQQRTQKRDQAAADAISGVIDRMQADRQANPGEPQSTTALDQLELQLRSIQADSGRPAVEVVQAPLETAPPAAAPFWSLGLVGGALLGAVAALATALAWRVRVGLITSRSSLVEEFEYVMSPVVHLPGDEAVGRALYAQLHSPHSGRVVVVGASRTSGASTVARLLDTAVGERGADTATGVHRQPEDRERCIVVNGGSVDRTAELPDLISGSSEVIVVTAIGQDVFDATRVAVNCAANQGIRVSLVGTRRPFFKAGD